MYTATILSACMYTHTHTCMHARVYTHTHTGTHTPGDIDIMDINLKRQQNPRYKTEGVTCCWLMWQLTNNALQSCTVV